MSVVAENQAQDALTSLGLTHAAAHLDTVAQQAAAGAWSYSHFAGVLLAGEIRERQRKRASLNLKFANFPVIKRLTDFDFSAQPSIDRRLIEELATGRYLSEGRNIVLQGPPGVTFWRYGLKQLHSDPESTAIPSRPRKMRMRR